MKEGGALHVRIKGRLQGIEPDLQDHAFTIHNGPADYRHGCSQLNGHFNPTNTPHGAPNDPPNKRHVGDLGNIYVRRFGYADIHTNDDLIQVGTGNQDYDIVGKTLAVHILPDNFGRVDNLTKAIPAIDNGAIIACGNIELTPAGSSAQNLQFSFLLTLMVVSFVFYCKF